ncbi:MAG: choice-of-anchor tandem repeat GloVer-containing protein [Terriglobales bacterium]
MIASPAQTLTTLHSFDNTDGAVPERLVQATSGKLYGTAGEGGASGDGTIFTITTSDKLKTLLSLDGTDGANPYGLPLVQATNGDFYGTLQAGGAYPALCGGYGCGTVFKITASGKITTLYNFCSQDNCTDGADPLTGLVQATNGDFYGTTNSGGANCVADGGCGTIFKITASGTLATVYSFCSQSNCTDGAYPTSGPIQGSDGNFYGTANTGGAYGYGTVYQLTQSGTLTTLLSFDNTNGNGPRNLIQASNGNLYGSTHYGGTSTACTNGCGVVFSMTLNGTQLDVYSFDNTDGFNPSTPVQATDENFYGTTHGGAYGEGTIYELTAGGTLTTLYNFCAKTGCPDGATPAGLMQDTNGNFYGTTYAGGTSDACSGGCGTIYSFSVGLGPFVETQTTSGKVGAAVKILGTNLTGATSVTFNGTEAVFKVVSSSEISAKVPKGATSGEVQVVTPGGTLDSNQEFQVIP